MFQSTLIINGQAVPALGGHTYERRDPLTDAVVTRAASGGPDEASAAVDAAAAAFGDWSATAPGTRAKLLERAADLLAERAGEVVPIAAEEIGSSEGWTRFNVDIASQTLRHAAKLAPMVGEVPAETGPDGVQYRMFRRAAGVVLGIAPWNAAVTLAVRAMAAPLACGNTMVLKASELCPKTHEWVVSVLNDAGLPPGVVNFITNAPENADAVVEAMVAHPAVRRVNFTGSTRVGREIAMVCARHLKPVLLELSGKAAMVVLADADLDAAARAAAHGAFFNQGQVCMSTDRIVIEEAVADEFVALLVAEVERLRARPDGKGPGPLGTLISAQAVLRVRGLVDNAVAKGATLVTGAEIFNTTMQPTVLDNVVPGMRIYSEESFGPVAAIIRVGDAEEAISVANDTEFGLAAAVFSRDADKATRLVRQIETGIGHVNGSTVFDDPAMPFGGVKASGYGRFGGTAALHEFTELHWIAIHDAHHKVPTIPASAG